MLTQTLDIQSVLAGYDAVVPLYPYVPPLSHWRAWEYAAYQHFALQGKVLDLGCGDGRYFTLIWPNVTEVVGVDKDPLVAELGRKSGVYRKVHVASAHKIPEPDGSFDHIFANCSLEHMDHLGSVLQEVHRCLRPDGTLLCSVVTDRFVEWSPLQNLVAMAGFEDAARNLHEDFLDFHHLVNPLPVEGWTQAFSQAGLVPETHIPLLPVNNSGIFFLMDGLWHVKKADGGELGDVLFPFLSSNTSFPSAFRKMLHGLLEMETDWLESSGAVFCVRKQGESHE